MISLAVWATLTAKCVIVLRLHCQADWLALPAVLTCHRKPLQGYSYTVGVYCSAHTLHTLDDVIMIHSIDFTQPHCYSHNLSCVTYPSHTLVINTSTHGGQPSYTWVIIYLIQVSRNTLNFCFSLYLPTSLIGLRFFFSSGSWLSTLYSFLSMLPPFFGAGDRSRTYNRLITNQMHNLLCYASIYLTAISR